MLFLPLGKLQDSTDTLLFGVADEAACVDNGYLAVRVVRVVHALVAGQLKLPHESFSINQVLGATQRDYIYLVGMHQLPNSEWNLMRTSRTSISVISSSSSSFIATLTLSVEALRK